MRRPLAFSRPQWPSRGPASPAPGSVLAASTGETVIAEAAGEVEELVAATEESTTSFSDQGPAGECPARRKGPRGISRCRPRTLGHGGVEFEQHVSTRSALAFRPEPCAGRWPPRGHKKPSRGRPSPAHGSGPLLGLCPSNGHGPRGQYGSASQGHASRWCPLGGRGLWGRPVATWRCVLTRR